MKTKFTKTICLVLALSMMLAVGSFSVSAATDVVPEMTFDDGAVGTWNSVTSNIHNIVSLDTSADPEDETNTVLHYTSRHDDGTTKKNTGIDIVFDVQSENIVEYQFDFYTGAAAIGRKFFYVKGNGSTNMQIFQINQGTNNAMLMYSWDKTGGLKTIDKDSWYTFKIIVDMVAKEKYLLYKKTGDAAWIDATTIADYNETEITSVKGMVIGNTNIDKMEFYLDNYSVKVISQDELADLLSGIYKAEAAYVTVPTTELTQNPNADGTKILYNTGETSGITEINFKYELPAFETGQTRICFTENSAGAAYNYGRRELFDINNNGIMRARVGSGGTINWMYNAGDTLTPGETYDFKLVAYLDTATYEVYYKEASEDTYKSFAESLKISGLDTTDNFGTYYTDDPEKLNSITKLEFLTPADASANISDVTVTCYDIPANVIAQNNAYAYKAYYDTLKEAGIVKDTFNPVTDAANLTAILENAITGSQDILFASTCPAIYAVSSVAYSAAKDAANADAITAAAEEATARVNENVFINANKYIRKALLLNALKSEAAAMNLYFADASMRETASIENARYAVVDGATVSDTATMFIASYNEEGVMKNVSDFYTVAAENYFPVKYQLPSGTASVKAFIWKDNGLALIPLAQTASK